MIKSNHILRTSFAKYVWQTMSVLAAVICAFTVYVVSEKTIDATYEQRINSLRLADELRQSADDLTRMARVYVVTGDPLYLRNYQQILDIRDGRKPRPERYDGLYWSLVTSAGTLPRPDSGQKVALLELMRSAGFTDQEFSVLAQAKLLSDELTHTEQEAMRLRQVQGSAAAASHARALSMLHDPAYITAKTAIMQPIDRFYTLMEERTRSAVQSAQRNALLMRDVFIGFGLALVLMLYRTSRVLQSIMGGPVDELHAQITRMGHGDFTTPVQVPGKQAGTVLAHLAETQAELQRMDDEHRRTEGSLRLAASVFTHAREGIMITSPDSTIIDVNEAFTRITGYSREEALGHNPRILRSECQSQEFYTTMWRELADNGHWSSEIWNRRKNGVLYAAMETISAVYNEGGEVLQYVCLFSDITATKEHERQLERMAHCDALTGLPNRLAANLRIHSEFLGMKRSQNAYAVLMMDIDFFKRINDTHGHAIGDQVLQRLAHTLSTTLRESDFVARFGGEEFLALLPATDFAAACQVAEKLQQTVESSPDPTAGPITISIGISMAHPAQADEDVALNAADKCLYEAKRTGRNKVVATNALGGTAQHTRA